MHFGKNITLFRVQSPGLEKYIARSKYGVVGVESVASQSVLHTHCCWKW